jgi:Clp protease/Mu-like prophage I protein
MAASAGSVIAMAGDEIVMGIGAQMMIHDAWGYAMGNAATMAAEQRALDSISDAYAAAYAARAGGTAADWRTVMQAETWYTGEEAVAAGLADRVAAADEVATAEGEQIVPGRSSYGSWDMWDSLARADRFDLSAYTYPGRAAAPPPAMPGRSTPAAAAAGSTTGRSGPVAFSDEQLSTMRQRLGLAEDADEQTIVDALGEALDEQADDKPDDGEGAPETAPAAGLPDGVVAVDAATLAQLRTQAARGEAARVQQEREHREAIVAAAVSDGRIAPARRTAWLRQLEVDPGAAETLAGLEKGLVPLAELGHASAAGPDDPATTDDYWFPGVVTTSREG